MRLIDLPITLREAAVKNQIAQGNKRDVYKYLHQIEDDGNFIWINTRQGWEFWEFADEGHFSETLKYRL